MGLGQLTIDFCAILLTVRVETENHVREDSIKCMISFFPSVDGLTFGGCWADRSFCSPLLVICYTALSLTRWLLPKKKKKHSLFWFPREFFKKPLMSITTSILTDEKAKIAYHDFHHTLENQISSYISPLYLLTFLHSLFNPIDGMIFRSGPPFLGRDCDDDAILIEW